MFNPEQPVTPADLQEARRAYEEAQKQFREALAKATLAYLGDPMDQTLPPEALDTPSKPTKE